MDGHPGFHICVGAEAPTVEIVGEPPLPGSEWIAPRTPPGADDPDDEPGEWDEMLIRLVVAEIRDAGVDGPRTWRPDLRKLRSASRVPSKARPPAPRTNRRR